ncbi:PemK-like, MazF-like toxin of type II toxin-antitoxin system [Primorskyibacter sedentarius]|uniref:PemK-like, MazF-like toxin of type II toxin-antitoxin system n=1 Tax=Primorskyibacter sedentarius TaxID=745311 RepID=A0A4R3J4R5_9RHOB|nr:type II toxin-antitoxin system PemK/MazF family toxin [Primorskyibacter sedentarius]TCS60265.1 PemK-like, MazF-like toxin of type II toxin-antitoxin system [Primorskyibacter sedentarius]
MYHSPKSFVPVFDWKDLVERGDVVLFAFPVNEDADGPTEEPKRRPCLVLDVFELNGTKFVELAYGTSARTKANTGYEVRVGHTASCDAAGLDRPSRFVCARRVIVSVNHPGFEGGDERGTRIGRLDPPLLDRMNAVRARLQAEADIRAEERRERREEEARWQREERGLLERNRASCATIPLKSKGDLV